MNPFLRFAIHTAIHTAGAALAFYAIAAALAETLTQPLITTPENTWTCPNCHVEVDTDEWTEDLDWAIALHKYYTHGPGRGLLNDVLRKHGLDGEQP